MSKKFLPILVVAALTLAAVLLALPQGATASKLLIITGTPSPTPTTTPTGTLTTTPTDTPTGIVTPDTPTPTKETTPRTPQPKKTELVLLPATGEFPIDPAQGMQWFFALTMIFLIGFILIRTVKGSKTKK